MKGGYIVLSTRKHLESELGETVVTQNNKLNYEYIDEKILVNKEKMTNMIYITDNIHIDFRGIYGTKSCTLL